MYLRYFLVKCLNEILEESMNEFEAKSSKELLDELFRKFLQES